MKKSVCVLFAILCLTACGETKQDRSFFAASGSGYEFSVPEGFSEMKLEGFEVFYSAEDGSCISLNIQEKDPAFQDVSARLLNETLSSVLLKTYGEEVAVTDNYFTRETVYGYPSYRYSFSYSFQGGDVRQLVVGIDADKCYTFTYTDLSGEWTELFEESADTIALKE